MGFWLSNFSKLYVLGGICFADCIYGQEEVQCRFPTDVQTSKTYPVYWIYSHTCYNVCIPQSYCWRHFLKLVGFPTNRMGSSSGAHIILLL